VNPTDTNVETGVRNTTNAGAQPAFWMVRQSRGVESYYRIDTQGADGEVWARVASDCEYAARSYAAITGGTVEAITSEQFSLTLLSAITRTLDPERQWLYFLDPVAEGEDSTTGTIIWLPCLVEDAVLHLLHREAEEIRQGIASDGQHRTGLAGHPSHGPYRRLLAHVLANLGKARIEADAETPRPDHQMDP
jgi:hypothetical protein